MSDAPKVSVIIPNYNYARYLRGRIHSVLSQTFSDFEVIILDDCSTDDSRSIIEEYSHHPRVSQVIFNEENSGNPFCQWDKGLSVAKGKYAWIAEADDLADHRFLEKAVQAIEADSSIAVVKSMSRLIDSEGNPSSHAPFDEFSPDGHTYIYEGDEYLKKEMIWWNRCYNASMMLFSVDRWRTLQKEFAGEPAPSEFRHVGDWLFWSRMIAGQKLAEVRIELNQFRIHGASVIGDARRISLAVEGEKVKLLISRYAGSGMNGYRRHARYQLSRYMESGRIPVSLWLYKHLLWPLQIRRMKSRGAKPRRLN